MTLDEGLAVLASALVSALLTLLGTIFASRSTSKSATFDTMVKAYQAISEENQRLRGVETEKDTEIARLKLELSRCYEWRGRRD